MNIEIKKDENIKNFFKNENINIKIIDIKDTTISIKKEGKIEVNGYVIYDTYEPKKNNNRFYLELNINETIKDEEDKILTVIMMNPSNTIPKKDGTNFKIDDTIKNVIQIAYVCKYSKIKILNILPLINGSSENAINKQDNNKAEDINSKFIKTYLSNYTGDLMIAWGSKTEEKKEKYVNSVKDIIKNKNINCFAYKLTKQCIPMHPSKQVENHYKYVSIFINSSNPKLIQIELDDKNNWKKSS